MKLRRSARQAMKLLTQRFPLLKDIQLNPAEVDTLAPRHIQLHQVGLLRHLTQHENLQNTDPEFSILELSLKSSFSGYEEVNFEALEDLTADRSEDSRALATPSNPNTLPTPSNPNALPAPSNPNAFATPSNPNAQQNSEEEDIEHDEEDAERDEEDTDGTSGEEWSTHAEQKKSARKRKRRANANTPRPRKKTSRPPCIAKTKSPPQFPSVSYEKRSPMDAPTREKFHALRPANLSSKEWKAERKRQYNAWWQGQKHARVVEVHTVQDGFDVPRDSRISKPAWMGLRASADMRSSIQLALTQGASQVAQTILEGITRIPYVPHLAVAVCDLSSRMFLYRSQLTPNILEDILPKVNTAIPHFVQSITHGFSEDDMQNNSRGDHWFSIAGHDRNNRQRPEATKFQKNNHLAITRAFNPGQIFHTLTLSSATATDQLRRFSRKAKPNNTGESDQEEMPGNNSDNNSEEPEDSHVAQVLRNITQKGKGSSTLAHKAVVASIKASSASSSKLSKAKEETNRTKSRLPATTAVQEAEVHTEFKVMSLSIYPVGTYLVEEGYFPRQKPTKVYRDLTSLVDIGCAQIATISQPIVFDRKDTYEEVTDRLRALCPLVMEYMDSRFMYRKKSNPEYPKHDSDPAHAYLPEIILCKKDRTHGMLPLTGPSAFFPDGEMLWRIATKHGSANTNALTREPISKGRLSLFQEAIQKGKQMNVTPITAFYTLEENTELSATEDDEEEEEGRVVDCGSEEAEENTSDEDQKDYQEGKETEVDEEEIVNTGAVSGNSEEEEELVEGALRPPFTQKRPRSESEPSGEDERPPKKRKGNGLRSYSGSSSEPQTEEAEEDTTNTPKPRSRAFLRQTGSPHMRSILRNADRARKFFGVTVDEVEDDLGFRTDYSSDREYASNLFEKPTSSTPQVNTSATASTSQASTSTSNPSNSMAAFLTYYKPPLSDKSRERLDPWKQV
ncbi:uncharacterized protein C8R40DRAFT_1165874 [Lentinula edodes]|uniref:uncharacterized protein n=1 Tax=Lentinula edodes TaxID=5353 RepID=UPI001E8CCBA4|nr:uncharacterized protein C8R40DRAFT_1165874 [Lentinula edodes]KAH7879617.1 hypothetical protein C8R40DRAFT_1165874 [Lentinula edodes]